MLLLSLSLNLIVGISTLLISFSHLKVLPTVYLAYPVNAALFKLTVYFLLLDIIYPE